MSESRKHMELVQLAYSWVKENVPANGRSFIEIDSPETYQSNEVTGFKPDVYYDYNNQLYIGEAKTINDFETRHSRAQYDAYLNRCEKYDGKACFVICVPWQLMSTAKNYFRVYKKRWQYSTPVVVLTDMNTVNRI